ncbi:MAG TPA: alpha-glucan family phosphorylase [Bryobacteraceae bacterium]|nr:alpha-glucan family phosphorylase [Bryobacteraceae bacterium]
MDELTERDLTRPSSAADELTELALNLRWSWNHSADELWAVLDPELWELTQNPWVMLQTVSRDKLEAITSQSGFQQKLSRLIQEKRHDEQTAAWFQKTYERAPFGAVTYFSLEFMLSDALPIYSGGLGNVAGDQLKAASDLGVPVFAVGLLYQVGYFRQHIDAEGRQLALYPFNDPGQLPIRPVREPNGEWLRITLDLPGFKLWIRTWEVRVGRTKLYLLDTNDPANLPEYRGITSELYGGGPELRISQEQVLGIGGWRLLQALGIKPTVCHLNEGHAAFVVLERAHSYMIETGAPFDIALAATRAGNLFTTHTPVEAGFDRFPPELVERHFRAYAENALKISTRDLLALGRRDSENDSEPFSMAYLAMRGSGAVNGVSRLHGQVSRRLFQDLFPRWPQIEVPISHVTNGVHVPIWDSVESDDIWTTACGKQRWHGDLEQLEGNLRCVSDTQLWTMRSSARKSLIGYVRKRLSRQLAGHGASADEIRQAEQIFDPDSLTLGFARRFATYKRPNLLLHDPDRLLSILTSKTKPVQLILAGKAHPQDVAGQEMIRQWIEFIRHTPARMHAVFLSDYDMRLTEHLVQGVDLWLNTPRRPWEACGTSGMKILGNGGLNLSELDGWWAEAYSPEVGWSLGDGEEHGADPEWDAAEAERLYTLLEQEIIPEFYNRDVSGIPVGWTSRIRESMARLTPQFSATRAVREYTEKHYVPLAAAYLGRTSDGNRTAENLLNWRQQILQHWPKLRFGPLSVTTNADQHRFDVQVYLGELAFDAIQVELYADPLDGRDPVREVMTRGESLIGSENAFHYQSGVPANRPANHFTPRIIPNHAAASVPLELSQILWYR